MNAKKNASVREALKIVKDRIKSEKKEDSEKKEFDVRRAAELMAGVKEESGK